MTRAEQEQRRVYRVFCNKIFRSLSDYLMGPKNTAKYCIDCVHKGSHADKITVDNGYTGYSVTFYFDYRIRVFVKCPYLRREVFYTFSECIFYDDPEYLRIVTGFFRSFIFMTTGMDNPLESYPHMYRAADGLIYGGATAGYEDCPDSLKGILPCFEYIVFHEWNDSNLSDLEYFTKLVGSKKFRRSMYRK